MRGTHQATTRGDPGMNDVAPARHGTEDALKGRYLETVQLMERLHRQFLELVQAELDGAQTADVNSVQSLIVHAIGRDEVLVGDLTQRGYYLGTNVSYNVRRLVEGGYLEQERSAHDRRALKLRLTPKGLALSDRLDSVFDSHVRGLEGAALLDELARASSVLRSLSSFWERSAPQL
jgi:DNA-binding MarR family transcriptional regulator